MHRVLRRKQPSGVDALLREPHSLETGPGVIGPFDWTFVLMATYPRRFVDFYPIDKTKSRGAT
jgi:hypothetical protein